jgi:transcriptional regulator with XRE-family HTH domain
VVFVLNTFGKRLKEIRIERGLRQEDIGAIVHVGKSTVSQWENNVHVPDIETIAKIASHLNVSIDYLLGRTDISNPTELTIDEELAQIMKDLGPDITLQFYDLKGMTDEEKENLKIFLQGLKARREQREGKQ